MKSNRHNLIVWITCALLLIAVPVGAVTLADVPADHWAYEAVSTLVEKGYMFVGEDQNFRGDEPADRYTLASVVAKIITEIESGRVSTTPEDVRTLRELIEEFRTELIFYYAEVQRVEGEAHGLYQELAALDELQVETITQLGMLYSDLLALDNRAQALEAAMKTADAELAGQLEAEVAAVRTSIDSLATSFGLDLDALRALIEEIGENLDRRSFELAQTDQEIRHDVAGLAEELKAEQSERKLAVDALRAELDRLNLLLSEQGTELSGQLAGHAGELSVRISDLWATLEQIESDFAARLAAAEGVMATKSDITRLEELIAQTRDGVYDNAEGLFFLSESLNQAEQKQAELAQRLEAAEQGSADQFRAVEAALAELKQQLQIQGSGLASSELNLTQVQKTLDLVRQELAEQIAAVAADQINASEALARVDGQLLAAIEELSRQIEANRKTSTETEAKLATLEAAVAEVQGSLFERFDAIVSDHTALKGEISGIRQDLLVLQSQVGLSEEQVQELTQRVKEEMANQLALSLAREGQIERELSSLRSEFDSYRQTTEEQLKTANTAQMIGIGALILGLIGFFM